MAVYEYKCNKCGEKFELRLSIFQNRKSAKCPKCGDESTERVYSPVHTEPSRDNSGSSSWFS